ncbi:hypothetical protein P7C73_g121, partial [Tremellales sp. Uapishka_1]
MRAGIIKAAKSLTSISPQALRSHLLNPSPLHLTNLVSHWPALSTWRLSDGLQALRDGVGDHREVEVEVGKQGRGYLDPDWQRVTMGFGLFLDAFILQNIPSSSRDLPIGYLAQADLLEAPSAISSAVPHLPHFDVGPRGSFYRRTIWIGPSGSFTPFHRDPYMGIYSQNAERFLDPSPIQIHSNTSRIPIPISRLFPTHSGAVNKDLPLEIVNKLGDHLKKAFAMPGACQVDLSAGESVLVPEGWWHSAEGTHGPGVGVGGWFR